MSARIPGKIEQVREVANKNLRLSAREYALFFNMSRRSLMRILHIDLKYHP